MTDLRGTMVSPKQKRHAGSKDLAQSRDRLGYAIGYDTRHGFGANDVAAGFVEAANISHEYGGFEPTGAAAGMLGTERATVVLRHGHVLAAMTRGCGRVPE